MRLIPTRSMRYYDPPILNKSTDGESTSHGAKGALHCQLVSTQRGLMFEIHTASKGKAVEANHHRLEAPI